MAEGTVTQTDGQATANVSLTDGQTGQAAGQTEQKPWFESLGADLKDNATVRRYKTVDDFANAHISLLKQFSGNKVALPDKHATEADWDVMLSKLTEADTTEVKFKSEEDKAAAKDFLDKAKELKLLPRQMQKLMDWYSERTGALVSEQAQQSELAVATAVKALQRDLGQAFEPSLLKARAALKHYGEGVEGLTEFLEKNSVGGVPLTSHPVMVKLMLKVADSMKEGTFKGDQFLSTNLTPDAARQRINEILADMNHPYYNEGHPKHKTANQEVRDLYSLLG